MKNFKTLLVFTICIFSSSAFAQNQTDIANIWTSGGVYNLASDITYVAGIPVIKTDSSAVTVNGNGYIINTNGLNGFSITSGSPVINFSNVTVKNAGSQAFNFSSAGNITANFVNTVFSSNKDMSPTGAGGAVYANGPHALAFSGGTIFDGNQSTMNGGAVYSSSGSSFNFYDSVVFSNNTARNGGAVYSSSSSTFNFNDSVVFSYNAADLGGATAIVSGSGRAVFTNAVFIGNTASQAGGALYLGDIMGGSGAPEVLITQTDTQTAGLFQGNTAGGASNAVFIDRVGHITFDAVSGANINMYDGIASNTALAAGGILMSKSGAGNFNLYGSMNKYAGDLDISGGNFNVMAGGVLNAGNAVIAPAAAGDAPVLNLQNGVNIADTVTFNTLTAGAGSDIKMNVFANGTNDRINVAGAAVLDGALHVSAGVGTYKNTVYTLIYSGTGTPTGALVDDIAAGAGLLAFLDAGGISNADYQWKFDTDSNAVILNILFAQVSSDIASSTPKLTYNQRQAAQTLDAVSASSSGDLADVINAVVSLGNAQRARALSQISPYFLANVLRARNSPAYRLNMYNRLRNYCEDGVCSKNYGLWLQGDAAHETLSGNENSVGDFRNSSSGISFGGDKYFCEYDAVLGLYGKYNDAEMRQGPSDASVYSLGAGVYAGLDREEWELKGLFGLSADNYKTKRRIIAPGLSRTATADISGATFTLDAEAALKRPLSAATLLRPYLGLQGNMLNYGGFTESGAGGLDLKFDGGSSFASAARAGVGVKTQTGIFNLSFGGEYDFIFAGQSNKLSAYFDGTDGKFYAKGANYGRNMFSLLAGAEAPVAENWNVYLNAAYRTASYYKDYEGNLGVRYSFCGPKEKLVPLPAPAPAPAVKPAPKPAAPPPPTASEEKLQLGKTLVMGSNYFDTDSYALIPKTREYLAIKTAELKELNYSRVIITGHTDNTGNLKHNMTLSRDRARAAAQYLAEHGIDRTKIEFKGEGPDRPVATNSTVEGRQKNRRVEITVI
ncbi:MAG: autotransporter domain-containing protein [Elusimicrobium sp.]|jgi:predicted outer membrane repeat protein|nr:autotransporter domain-containing protein [Elusimicrobium sp.]